MYCCLGNDPKTPRMILNPTLYLAKRPSMWASNATVLPSPCSSLVGGLYFMLGIWVQIKGMLPRSCKARRSKRTGGDRCHDGAWVTA